MSLSRISQNNSYVNTCSGHILTVVAFAVPVDLEQAVIASAPLSYRGKVKSTTHVTHIEGYQVITERTKKVRSLCCRRLHWICWVDCQGFFEPCCLRDAGTAECWRQQSIVPIGPAKCVWMGWITLSHNNSFLFKSIKLHFYADPRS